MPEFKIRPYKPGDEVFINDAFNKIFQKDRTLEEWRWKFDPEKNRSAIMVAVDEDNNMLAHYAATISDVGINGKVYRCGQPVDAFALRQQGTLQYRLYAKTVRNFFSTFGGEDKIHLLYGFPNKKHLKIGQVKLDYGDPVEVEVGIRPVRFRRRIFRRRPNYHKIDTTLFEDIWERSSGRYPVSVLRNADRVTWRYNECPHNKYFSIDIKEDGITSACAVLTFEKKVMKLIDLVWDGRNKNALAELDGILVETARAAGSPWVEVWLSNDEEAKNILIEKGWKFAPHGDLFLVAMSFHPDLNSNEFIRCLYFTLGDSDLV